MYHKIMKMTTVLKVLAATAAVMLAMKMHRVETDSTA
jgi:hypothetical protein